MSFLRIGTPHRKVRPPRGGPPCTEPYVTGTNVLKDPGFELQLSNYTGGPNGDEIPYFSGGAFPTYSSVPYYWSDVDTIMGNRTFWSMDIDGVFSSFTSNWIISTTNPHSGTYHARRREYTDAYNPQYLVASQNTFCHAITPGTSGNEYATYTARVEPGDFVKFGVWASASEVTASPQIWLYVDGIGTDWLYSPWTIASASAINLTTSYVYHEISGFVDTTTYAVIAYVETVQDETATTYIDIDDCVLEVT